MIQKKKNKIPSAILQDTPSSSSLLSDIKNLSVEDLIVVYAYAEAIVETVREPLIILDKELSIKSANKAFFETFEVNKIETYNKPIFELGNGQWNIPELKKLLLEILPKDNFLYDFEVTHMFESIGQKIMLLNARRIVLEGQNTHLILLAIEDVTEKKKTEHQKDDFIAIASHELKTPLTSIKMLVEILKMQHKENGDTKSATIVEKVESQVNRLTDMMASFTNVYKLQTSNMELNKVSINVTKLVTDVVETFQFISETHSIKLLGTANKKLFADKERLEQVLINIISNAIKYSPQADKVVVKIKEDKKNLMISIQDFGIGIRKDQQTKIFNRFYRIKGTEKISIEGLGLGLFISSEIVKDHNGTITLKSEKNKGTTFTISLPYKMVKKNL
ncbi:MAG: cell wall metabolism sensor histidine kinase WalK [bacterium]|nr:cell wall metabolism sensor histidine kinase WalK [bacterium]